MSGRTMATVAHDEHVVSLERRPRLRSRTWLRVTDPAGDELVSAPVGVLTQWRLPSGDWVVADARSPRGSAAVRLDFDGGGTVVAACSGRSWLAIVGAADGDRPFTATWLGRFEADVLERVQMPSMANTIDDGMWYGYAPLAD